MPYKRQQQLRMPTGRALYDHKHLPYMINSHSITCQKKKSLTNYTKLTYLKCCRQVRRDGLEQPTVEGRTSVLKVLDLENKQINDQTISLTYFPFYFPYFIRKSKASKMTHIFYIISLFTFQNRRG